jgi:hypothetical protein
MRMLPFRFRVPRRALTTQNVLATLAVFASLTGTAFAARTVLYTGANVRNSSLTSIDVKDRSLPSTDFTSVARTQLKAQAGAKGDTGATGAIGNQGRTGTKGPDGPDAGRAYSFITATDVNSYVGPRSGSKSNPPTFACPTNDPDTLLAAATGVDDNCTGFTPFYPHWAYDCEANSLAKYCNRKDDGGLGTAGSGATVMQTNLDGVVSFTGDENGSFVTLMGPGNIVVTGSLTFLHPVDNFHSRVACQAEARKSDSADAYTKLGVPIMVTGREYNELVHLTVTGAGRFQEKGDYDFQIECAMLDEYSTSLNVDNWIFVSGNATATTTEL